MTDHDAEECRIEPRERTIETSYQSPGKGKKHITAVVYLPRKSITPVSQDPIASRGLNGLGAVNFLPRKLRERLALHKGTALHHSERVLLTIRRVPYPVDEEICREKRSERIIVPCIRGGVMVRKV